MYNISFHLTDECNLRCKDCHWFSCEIKNSEYIPYTDYINWINKNISEIMTIRLTGGEPTLYKDFIELVNNIPEIINVVVCSNGINIDILREIKRNVMLLISTNRKIKPDFKEKIESIGQLTNYLSYIGDNPNLNNQISNGKDFENLNIIGKKCQCLPKLIRFGSDGYAYNCEIGLRTKRQELRNGFSLWKGKINKEPIKCTIEKDCFSNFVDENKYTLIV